jgi:hypothetical protein
VHPYPEAIFYPLEIRLGPRRDGSCRRSVDHSGLALPDDDPVFDAALKVMDGDELQVDVQERGP